MLTQTYTQSRPGEEQFYYTTEEKGGCGSFVATNIVAIVGLTAGAGVFFCRKKTRD